MVTFFWDEREHLLLSRGDVPGYLSEVFLEEEFDFRHTANGNK